MVLYPSLGISHNLLMGFGVSDFVSVGHIFAFLSSHYTFSSRARILKCQSRHLSETRIYHSPPLIVSEAESDSGGSRGVCSHDGSNSDTGSDYNPEPSISAISSFFNRKEL